MTNFIVISIPDELFAIESKPPNKLAKNATPVTGTKYCDTTSLSACRAKPSECLKLCQNIYRLSITYN